MPIITGHAQLRPPLVNTVLSKFHNGTDVLFRDIWRPVMNHGMGNL